jgi:AcrR family transcriptional regulator
MLEQLCTLCTRRAKQRDPDGNASATLKQRTTRHIKRRPTIVGLILWAHSRHTSLLVTQESSSRTLSRYALEINDHSEPSHARSAMGRVATIPPTMTAQTPKPGGLRERKQRRTRETIIRVALDLFTEQGYRQTTLTQIAAAAEIAPSTLHTYFASKEDIVFETHDAVRESITTRIRNRPHTETLTDALAAWTSDSFPNTIATESPERNAQRRATIEANETLRAAERLRRAHLEDAFAEAFAEDLGETPADLRARLMASIATNGLQTIWQWWQLHTTGPHFDPREVADLDATYLVSVLEATRNLLHAIPQPPGRLGSATSP